MKRRDWVKVLQEFEESGLSVKDFAAIRKIPVNTLRTQVYRMKSNEDTSKEGGEPFVKLVSKEVPHLEPEWLGRFLGTLLKAI